MSVKAETPSWPPPWMPPPASRLHVVAIQWGLGSYERYLAGDGEQWLAARAELRRRTARAAAERRAAGRRLGAPRGLQAHLLADAAVAVLDGPGRGREPARAHVPGDRAGALRRGRAPRAARARRRLGRRAACARAWAGAPSPRSIRPTRRRWCSTARSSRSGACTTSASRWRQPDTLAAFEQVVDTLAENLHRWDLGYWSRYDLFPHPVANVASSFYHDLHINQLRALQVLAPRPQIGAAAERFAGYVTSAANRRHAFARKALFRVLVPRNSLLARWHPSSPLRGA